MRTRLTIGAILAIVLPFVAVSADLSTLMTPDDVMLRKPSKPRRSGGGNPLFATSAANEQAAREKAAAEQAAREKAAAEQAAREKAAAEQAAREKAAAEQAAREKAAAEKAARDLADVERVAAEERTVRERAAKLESERLSMESKAKAALDAAAQAEIQKRAAEEAAAKATSEKREAEMAMARAASERQAAEAAAAEAAAAKKAAEDAAAKAEAEKALADEKAAAELKALREQIAAERAAREKAEADRLAAVQQAEAKMAEAKTVKTEAEAAINEVVQKVRDEKAARERAEAAVVAAEARAEAEKKAAEKAVEAQAAAEKRVNYLMNPDPDERPRPKKLVAEGDSKDVTETMPGEKAKKADKVDKKAAKKPLTGREAVITAERTDYDRKEGVILFDRNVYVDDEQYQMHADRLFVFLDGTNDLKRLVAIGHVAITNEEKTASCARAVYTKAVSKIVMYGDDTAKARLHEAAKKGDNDAQGDRITFWLNSEQVEIEGPVISMPGGALKGASGKSLLQQVK